MKEFTLSCIIQGTKKAKKKQFCFVMRKLKKAGYIRVIHVAACPLSIA